MASDVGAVVEESPRQIKEKMIYFQASIYRVGNQRYPRFQDYQASRRKCSGVGVEHLEHRASRTDGPLASRMPESRPRSSSTITRRIATQRKSMLPAAAWLAQCCSI